MLIVKEGLPLVIAAAVIGIIVVVLTRGTFWSIPGWVSIVLAIFFAYFFRDPVRQINSGSGLILSPADGTVLEVTQGGGVKTVRIFLSVFNVHLQRAPFPGKITNVEYRPGKFLPAMEKEAHVVNEQNIITMQTEKGNFKIFQIAGILARRVVSWVKPGDAVGQGQKIGFIKFGSQVDIEMPGGAEIKVKPGEKVTAGRTVIAEIK